MTMLLFEINVHDLSQQMLILQFLLRLLDAVHFSRRLIQSYFEKYTLYDSMYRF